MRHARRLSSTSKRMQTLRGNRAYLPPPQTVIEEPKNTNTNTNTNINVGNSIVTNSSNKSNTDYNKDNNNKSEVYTLVEALNKTEPSHKQDD
eukprot:Pgem_evm1s2872